MKRLTFRGSDKIRGFRDSVFSEFTGLCNQYKAVNLGQGFPDWEAPDFVKQAAVDAIQHNHNQYNRSMGHPLLVNTLEQVYKPRLPQLNGMKNAVVTAGATGEFGFLLLKCLN
jgi:aspartate/methionine/tyrosine aminotransferase